MAARRGHRPERGHAFPVEACRAPRRGAGIQERQQARRGIGAEQVAGGAKPGVLALARRLGLSNATFWRHFRDIATEVRHAVSVSMAPAGGENLRRDRAGGLASQNAGLRRDRDRLADQLEATLGHLRRLTIDNAQLRHDLEAARRITRLDPGRESPQRR